MRTLSFKDWFDKYAPDYDKDCDTLMTEDEFFEYEYECFISNIEDIAYEEYKDRQLWDDDDDI